jgi:hypothetical protein
LLCTDETENEGLALGLLGTDESDGAGLVLDMLAAEDIVGAGLEGRLFILLVGVASKPAKGSSTIFRIP